MEAEKADINVASTTGGKFGDSMKFWILVAVRIVLAAALLFATVLAGGMHVLLSVPVFGVSLFLYAILNEIGRAHV